VKCKTCLVITLLWIGPQALLILLRTPVTFTLPILLVPLLPLPPLVYLLLFFINFVFFILLLFLLITISHLDTGFNGEDGLYKVQFFRNGPKRTNFPIDCRRRSCVASADLLSNISVYYGVCD
jgi:hypothetical protein